MGTRRQMQVRILETLEEHGWRREAIERGREKWVDEWWLFRSLSTPAGLRAWLAFLVDPEWEGPRAPGEGVGSLAADLVRREEPTGWLIEIPLGRRWERGLTELVETLQASRAAQAPAAASARKPQQSGQGNSGRVRTKWKHLR